HRSPSFLLFAHQPNDVGGGPDELDAAGLDDFGEVGVLGQQPVSRMDRLDVRDLSGADDCRYIEVTLCQLWWTDADCLVGETDRQRVAVGLAIDRNRANP